MSLLTPTQDSNTSSRSGSLRYGGLDGLRAIAVALVLVYHLFPGILPGGFFGVDIFFVISGFLITSLLLTEIATTGRIALLNFWRRRARRLLPALALVLLVCTSLALIVGGDVLVGVAAQIFGASFFVNNWVLIAGGADYFAQDNPELFRNTWSLSIEEQFYLLLPIALFAIFKLGGRSATVTLFLTLGVISALTMAQLSSIDAPPTRIYFGSDTHTFGLFFGVALAILVHQDPRAGRPRPPGRFARSAQVLVAVLGFLVLGWSAVTAVEASPESFQGGFQLVTLAAVGVIWAITREGSVIGRAIDVAPLRWIGERSYGIYLWHWPLLLIIDGAIEAPSWIIGALTLVATLTAATLSCRYVEQPMRQMGLRRALTVFARPRAFIGRPRRAGIALWVILFVSLPATTFAAATAPSHTTAADAITRGEEALAAQDPEIVDPPVIDLPETGTQPASTLPALVTGAEITAVGDSVMLASAPELASAFPGISVDAEVSRGVQVGTEIVDAQSADGSLRSVIVVGLGTNGPVQTADLDSMRAITGSRPLVLVNAHGDREWIAEVNAALAAYADSHRGVVVADWDEIVSSKPEALAGDGIHPNPSGGELYASAITDALLDLAKPKEAIGFAVPRR